MTEKKYLAFTELVFATLRCQMYNSELSFKELP